VLGIQNGHFDIFEEVLQRALALDLASATQVEAVEVQEVEGLENQLVLSASSEFGLEF
jgi:hypothetical protein